MKGVRKGFVEFDNEKNTYFSINYNDFSSSQMNFVKYLNIFIYQFIIFYNVYKLFSK
jgi:hypothetical protein